MSKTIVALDFSSKQEVVLPEPASPDKRNQIHFSARNKDFRSQTADLYFHYTVESDNSLSIPAIPGAEPPFPGQQFSTFF